LLLELTEVALTHHFCTLKVPSFALKVPSFTLKDSSFALKVPSFALKVSSFALKDSSFALKVPSFALKVPSFALKISCYALIYSVSVLNFYNAPMYNGFTIGHISFLNPIKQNICRILRMAHQDYNIG